MAEHRRSMRALERVSSNAGRVAETTGARHLQVVPSDALQMERADGPRNVVSLAAVRARRSGHPAGSGLRDPRDGS
jgi:hypothetical protein